MPIEKEFKHNIIKQYSEKLIDSETELHYAFHKSLNDITIIHSQNFFEIFLIVKGEVLHIINSVTQKLTEGTLVFIRPTDIHYYKKSDQQNCYLINIAFPQKTVNELFNYLGNGFPSENLINSKLPPMVILSKNEKEIIQFKLEHLNTISRSDKKKIKTNLRILLIEIFTKYFISEFSEEKNQIPDWLGWLISEMQKKENFVKGISMMQQLAHKSPEHICRVFKNIYDKTPTEFVNELRLNYAANLLARSDENVLYISMEAGFENLSHFYHLFKKKFKMSPKEFRKINHISIIPQ
ncbi:MAG: AraC family transcriptional regulator [Ignavibacteriaceae bacterium]